MAAAIHYGRGGGEGVRKMEKDEGRWGVNVKDDWLLKKEERKKKTEKDWQICFVLVHHGDRRGSHTHTHTHTHTHNCSSSQHG